MRKAIQLKVTLWIKGEQEPAENFVTLTTQAVKDVISVGRWRHPSLKFTVKKVVEDTDYDSEEQAVSKTA